MTNKKYKAFISYSHADIKFGRWLQKKIENYKIPKKLREKYPHLPKDLKRSIFRDEEELPSSSALPENLIHALESSEFLIVIASPYSTTSKWVNKEGQLEAFPLALIANGDEPIAGDARSFWGRKRAVKYLTKIDLARNFYELYYSLFLLNILIILKKQIESYDE